MDKLHPRKMLELDFASRKLLHSLMSLSGMPSLELGPPHLNGKLQDSLAIVTAFSRLMVPGGHITFEARFDSGA